MQPYPLPFQPVLKQTIWGGRSLGERLGKPIGPEKDYAESWEVVDHGADQSIVADGPLKGHSLSSLVKNHRDWLMGPGNTAESFPLLLKYLDCNRVLSVQVHPDDAYGATMNPPDLGKTEAWYVVDAKPNSLVYAGLKPGVDRVALSQAIETGQTETVLHSFHPRPGDVLFIPAGTVHALGAGLLIAEIQQSSDTTFRLFDWNRVDGHGKSRPLHIGPSLEVTDYASGPVHPIQSDPVASGWQTMAECDKFVLRALRCGSAKLAGDDEFHIVTVPSGRATLEFHGGKMDLPTGATVMLPAAMGACELSVHPGGTVLQSQLS